eukprot:COSAG02_NODE_5605_length_4194_cov_5.396825_1_plen_117_part_00
MASGWVKYSRGERCYYWDSVTDRYTLELPGEGVAESQEESDEGGFREEWEKVRLGHAGTVSPGLSVALSLCLSVCLSLSPPAAAAAARGGGGGSAILSRTAQISVSQRPSLRQHTA